MIQKVLMNITQASLDAAERNGKKKLQGEAVRAV
jgi:hypothetical protein